jgi:hypothetical protein
MGITLHRFVESLKISLRSFLSKIKKMDGAMFDGGALGVQRFACFKFLIFFSMNPNFHVKQELGFSDLK